MRFIPYTLLPLLLLTACGSGPTHTTTVEPVDLKPVGNAVEFLGICLVLAVVVGALALIILRGKGDGS